MMAKRYCLVLLLTTLVMARPSAQTLSSDEYFQMARRAAFDSSNYPSAIHLSKLALLQSPGYTDIQIFLGRIYYWNNQTDSSLQILKAAIEAKPAYEETYIALTDIEYYNEHYSSALYYCQNGLMYNPSSTELKLRQAKILAALYRYREAYTVVDSLLRTDPKNEAVRIMAGKIQELSSKNKVGISYDHTWFDKQFSDPWHLISLDYSRQTKAGSFITRMNYANRHVRNGVQFEVDAYPHISKTFYAYANIGYSADMPIFPKFRAGFSLYANLPHALELDAGFRYLNFDSDTWIYTLSVGKYYKKFWFNGRTYLTPSNSNISQSYTVTTRYYLKGASNYISFFIGRGISPDDRSLVSQLNNAYKLQSKKIGAGYRFTAGQMNIFSLSASYENVEYLPKTTGNQVTGSVGYMRRF
jgi:YaiO family outer membrane protein